MFQSREVISSELEFNQLANAIRFLAIDAVQAANSGHPGAPMGMADIATVLFREFVSHNPKNPQWANRDRFVLSNGHGSMLIYALLHLTGYDLSLEELKNFRQLHAKTAGHPEYGHVPGVETTTGPLGQGMANAVGMALAEKTLAAQFNTQGHDIIDHHTYVFLGDGCLMEGISHEVSSLAGRLGLGKLIAFYDDNNISIDGEVHGWFTDNTPARFEAYGWHVIPAVDGHNPAAIRQAIMQAQAETGRATLICCKTTIGFGSPNKSGKESSHGAPLGLDEIKLTRTGLAWGHQPFEVPDDVRAKWNSQEHGHSIEQLWDERFAAYAKDEPAQAAELKRRLAGELPDNWQAHTQAFIEQAQKGQKDVATRKASQAAIEAYAEILPEFLGGSADLTGSNNTNWSKSIALHTDPAGNYINYGVREFGMSAIMNGITLHGGFIPFGGTFLVFMEYARNAVRMAALMGIRTLFVYTHDSIGLGEDGPTHQPIEQLANLRSTPNLEAWRPCDAVESAVSWQQSIERTSGPSALIFSRQALPHQVRNTTQVENISRGGYLLYSSSSEHQDAIKADLVLMASGSEVGLVMAAAKELEQENLNVIVVSIPCMDRFLAQDEAYKKTLIPKVRACVAVEAGAPEHWHGLIGHHGKVLGMTTFGASGAAEDLFKHFGFTVANIVSLALESIEAAVPKI